MSLAQGEKVHDSAQHGAFPYLYGELPIELMPKLVNGLDIRV